MRLGPAKAINLVAQGRTKKKELFALLRGLHKEASRFVKEQGDFKRIKIEMKIVIR